jgi:hypothetical protein
MLASAVGDIEILKKILLNPTLNINIEDPKTGVNSFWIACFYDRGACMNALANAGINVLSKQKDTGANALHLAI